MRVLKSIILIFFAIALISDLHAQQGPSLDETIRYLKSKLAAETDHTYNNVCFRYHDIQIADGTLTMVVSRIQVTDVGSEIQQDFNIRVPLKSLSNNVAVEAAQAGGYKVTLETSDGTSSIVYGAESVTHIDIRYFYEQKEAESVANAFKHLIELSGGQADPFAPTPSQ